MSSPPRGGTRFLPAGTPETDFWGDPITLPTDGQGTWIFPTIGAPLVVSTGAGFVGLLLDVRSGAVSRFNVDNAGLTTVTTLQFDPIGTAHQIQLYSTAGIDGRRLNIASGDTPGPAVTGSAELQLVPANTAPLASMRAQIQIIGVAGTDLERLDISAVSNSYVIDTTANGAGVVRPIVFEAQGAPNAVAEQVALEILGDASVILRGDAFTDTNGVAFGSARTTIGDFHNTGTSYLLLDTRTTTPANNAGDATGIRLRRGGAEKWILGLNIDGANNDNFNLAPLGGNTGRVVINPGPGIAGDVGSGTASQLTLTNVVGIGNGANTNMQSPVKGTGGGPTSAVLVTDWLKIYDGVTVRWIPAFT